GERGEDRLVPLAVQHGKASLADRECQAELEPAAAAPVSRAMWLAEEDDGIGAANVLDVHQCRLPRRAGSLLAVVEPLGRDLDAVAPERRREGPQLEAPSISCRNIDPHHATSECWSTM